LADISAEDRATVEIVLAEVFNNIAEHAYSGRSGPVEVRLARQDAGLACQIGDNGAPMPEGKVPPGRLIDPSSVQLADLPEGGFGWALIRNLTTGLTYRQVDGWNRLGFLIPLCA
jgi:serine/threonine-protein kinase RsbW